jgi:hypothetical protein
MSCVGRLQAGSPQLRLTSEGEPVELPERLGFEHSRYSHRDNGGPAVADRP